MIRKIQTFVSICLSLLVLGSSMSLYATAINVNDNSSVTLPASDENNNNTDESDSSSFVPEYDESEKENYLDGVIFDSTDSYIIKRVTGVYNYDRTKLEDSEGKTSLISMAVMAKDKIINSKKDYVLYQRYVNDKLVDTQRLYNCYSSYRIFTGRKYYAPAGHYYILSDKNNKSIVSCEDKVIDIYQMGDEKIGKILQTGKMDSGMSNIVDLKTSEVSTNSINLTWTASNGADGYHIYKYGLDDKLKFIDTTNKNSHLIEDLEPGTYFSYIVVPYKTITDEDGNYIDQESSNWSNLACGSTEIYKPENLKTGTITENSISLTWDEAEGAECGYAIFMGDKDGNNMKRIGTSGYEGFTVYDLKPNTTYTFAVAGRTVIEDQYGSEEFISSNSSDKLSGATLSEISDNSITVSNSSSETELSSDADSSNLNDVVYTSGKIKVQSKTNSLTYRSYINLTSAELANSSTGYILFERYVNGKLVDTEKIYKCYSCYQTRNVKHYAPSGSYYLFSNRINVNPTDQVVDIYTIEGKTDSIKYGKVIQEGINDSSLIESSNTDSSSIGESSDINSSAQNSSSQNDSSSSNTDSSSSNDIIYNSDKIKTQIKDNSLTYRSFINLSSDELENSSTRCILFERYVNGKLVDTEKIYKCYSCYIAKNVKHYAPSGSYYLFSNGINVNPSDRVVDIYTIEGQTGSTKYGKVVQNGSNIASDNSGNNQ